MPAALEGADGLPDVLDRRLARRASGPRASGRCTSTTAGLSTRASAISAAGTVLSQPTMQTSASKSWAWTMSSIESAMTSRETSEARIPGRALRLVVGDRDRVERQRDAAGARRPPRRRARRARGG